MILSIFIKQILKVNKNSRNGSIKTHYIYYINNNKYKSFLDLLVFHPVKSDYHKYFLKIGAYLSKVHLTISLRFSD